MPPRDQESQGDRIARLRRIAGLSQAELAKRVGATASQISKYERNAHDPKVSTLNRIAAVLGTSTDYLITGKEAAPSEPDRLLALWPALEQLPLGLRNELAGFLKTILYAQTLVQGRQRSQERSAAGDGGV